ncbi:SRPBCC family protein [Nocardia sp. NPDC005366]|uniref:SRPBCC family protein n=1 Tax=Nocardia sp. NPDC005366 TaxID=3156878 RepID=UPI0033BF6D33
MPMKTTTACAIGLGTYLVGLTVGYQVLLRERCLNWGTTPDEVTRTMPGDELLSAPDIVATRAVTIDAAPPAIWPWLVQLGPGRGGAYTYDWIENLLGLDMHSAEEILPQFQNLTVGDTFTLGKSGPTMRVAVLDPERALVFSSSDGNWVWAFGLYPQHTGTRLVSRNRIATPTASAPVRLFNRLIMEPGSWVMERKMLQGIKQRVERVAVPTTDAART